MYLKEFSVLLVSAGLASCGSGSSDDNATNSGRTTTGAVEASDVGKLGLSGALNINLPDALSSGSSSLRLQDSSKSIEACLMRSSANESVTQISMAANIICHIEAEGPNIPWNTPVILDFPDEAAPAALRLKSGHTLTLQEFPPPGGPEGGPEGGPGGPGGPGGEGPGGDMNFEIPTMGIYADETDPDNIKVYICEGADEDNLKLVQSFVITGNKSVTNAAGESVDATKGVINILQEDDNFGNFAGAMSFDSNFTTVDSSTMKVEVKFDANDFAFKQNFSLAEAGDLIKVSIADSGTMKFGAESITFKNAGVGSFNATNGNVFMSYEGFGDPFSSQACVDSSSNLVSCDNAAFQAGGELYLTTDDIPAILSANFQPAAPSGFDCSAQTWTKVVPSTDAAAQAAHDACDAEIMAQFENQDSEASECFNGYAQGEGEVEIIFDETDGGEFGAEAGAEGEVELEVDLK